MTTASIDDLLFRFRSEPIPDSQKKRIGRITTYKPTNLNTCPPTSDTSHLTFSTSQALERIDNKTAQNESQANSNFAPAYRIVSPLFEKREKKNSNQIPNQPGRIKQEVKNTKKSPSPKAGVKNLSCSVPDHFKSLELWWLFAFPMVPLAFKKL